MSLSSDGRVKDTRAPRFENLEERLLLTTVYGGQIVEFGQPLAEYAEGFGGTDIRVALGGDIVAELIGIDLFGNVGDVPVRVYQDPLGGYSSVGGGLGALDGVTNIGAMPITDPTGATPDVAAGTEENNIQGIASQYCAHPTLGGRTYGFNVLSGSDDDEGSAPITQLVRINNDTGAATVVANMSDLLPFDVEQDEDDNDIEVSNVETVTAADFRPLDGSAEAGWLYFVVRYEPDEGDPTEELFAIDVEAAEADRDAFEAQGRLPAASLGSMIASDQESISSIAWDQTSETTSVLYGFLAVENDPPMVLQGVQMGPRIAFADFVTPVLTPVEPDEDPEDDALEGVTGIEFMGDDPTADERYLWAIDNANAQLVRIDLIGDPDAGIAPGTATAQGTLHGFNEGDPTDNRYSRDPLPENVRGDDLQGMAWNPVMVNPWTGGFGVMLGTDATTDELVYIRTGSGETARMQPDYTMPAGLVYAFAIYVTHAGPGASIAMAQVDYPTGDDDGPELADRVMDPFGGGFGDMHAIEAQEGEIIAVSADGATGLALLGGTTSEYELEDVPGWDRVIASEFRTEIGARPRNYDDWPGQAADLAAGLVVPEQLLDYLSDAGSLPNRLMGMNLDDIREMTVSRSGQIVVADFDGYDALGESYYDDGSGVWKAENMVGVELALIDPDTGWAMDMSPDDGLVALPPKLIHDDTDLPIRAVWGLDYGILDLQVGTETLYAVADAGCGELQLGTIDLSSYDTNIVRFAPLVTLNGLTEVTAMAFSTGEGSIANQQGLFLVDGESNLYEYDPATGAQLENFGPIEGAQHYPDGTPVLEEGEPVVEPVHVESMDFDDKGVLYAHDRYSGRLVDINIDLILAWRANPTGDEPALEAATRTRTSVGSFRPTVGAMAYDFVNDRFLAVDNAFSRIRRQDRDGGEASVVEDPDTGDLIEQRTNDSAALMVLRGYRSDSAVRQNMENVLIGGPVMGKVDVSGSIEMFYTGWLITGESFGILEETALPTIPDNFHVRGDLRNLISWGSIGTISLGDDPEAMVEPIYITGFDLRVGGKTGQVWSQGSLIGSFEFENQGDVMGMSPWNYWNEIELKLPDTPAEVREGRAFQSFRLLRPAGMEDFSNDTYETAQYIGTSRSAVDGDESVHIQGSLVRQEHVDFYALALMAGQTLTIWADNLGEWPMLVGVFDPDGRLIATDADDVDGEATVGNVFRVTAPRAGVYRFAVGRAPFDGSGSGYPAMVPYVLHMTFEDQYKNLAAGAIRVDESFFNPGVELFDLPERIIARRGDLGAIVVAETFYSEYRGEDGSGTDVWTADGNLRAVQATSLGLTEEEVDISPTEDDEEAEAVPDGSAGLVIYVYDGSVGLLRNTSDSHWLNVTAYVEGDVQTFDAAGALWISLDAFGGIGNLRAGSMATEPASVINLNVDQLEQDGIIDLIDVAGNLGTPLSGGPWIDTGRGGNVRFMRVGGMIFQCREFARNYPITTDVDAGESITLWDDSGTKIVITPVSDTVDETSGDLPIDPLTGEYLNDPFTDAPFVLPSVSVRYFGISGRVGNDGQGGGVVIVDVTASDSVEITTNSEGNGATAEIGRITLNGDGRAVEIDDLLNGAMSLAPHPFEGFETDLTVLVRDEVEGNPSPLDVWEVVGGNFTSIRNETGGDIVNVDAASIGELYSAGSLGVTANHTGAEVDAIAILSSDLPFATNLLGLPAEYRIGQTIGIVSGDIIAARAGRGLGNFIVSGTVGALAANVEGEVDHTDDDYRGIVAPVYVSGNLYTAQIGEGIAPSGTGGFARAGLFVNGTIRRVLNQGQGSDINGDIIAQGQIIRPSDSNGILGIRRIELTDGAIINADILTSDFGALQEFDPSGTYSGDIGQVIVTGIGGIIGTRITGRSIGRIEVNNGFGLFNSSISSVGGNGTIGHIIVDGFGLHDVLVTGGASVGRIIATGHGDLADTLDYTRTARHSQEQTGYDPFGRTMTDLIDIHEMLLTNVDSPMAVEGMISNLDASGQLDLGLVRGYQIITEGTTRLNDEGLALHSALTYANSIGKIIVEDEVNGLRIVTGRLGLFRPGADVYGLNMKVAGPIGKIAVDGNLADSSTIQSTGPNGFLGTLFVNGDFEGQLLVDGWVGNILIRGDLSGYVDIDATNENRLALRSFVLDGSLAYGSMNVDGHVGRIRVAHNLGQTNESLTINGNLGALQVGADPGVSGSTMGLDLNVIGDLGAFDIDGRITGDVYVKGTLGRLNVRADQDDIDNIITGELLVLGSLNNATLQGGSLGADVTVGEDIGTFRIVDGDLPATIAVTSSYGDIARFDVTRGDLYGSVRAVSGDLGAVNVTGSDFDGTLSGLNIGSVHVDGSLLGGALITTPGEIASVAVRGDVDTDATIEAGSARSITVNGDWKGLLDAGYTPQGTAVRIDGDLEGDLTIDAATTLNVGGDQLDGSTVSIGMDLTSLVVGDQASGDIFVDGRGGLLRVGSLIGGIITTGYDLQALLVSDAMSNSLVQVGISRGYDHHFAGTELDDGRTAIADYGETGRMATLGKLFVGDALNYSIVAAGGDLRQAVVRNGTDHASLSSGLVVGSEAIATVRDDDSPLQTGLELNNARNRDDRQLLRGDIQAVTVGGGGMEDSAVSAGVDAGASGNFANLGDNGVAVSLTGGTSSIGAIRGLVDDQTAIVADGGIRRAPAGIALRQDDVTYAVSDIVTIDATDVGTAEGGTPVELKDTEGNVVLTVSLIGPGEATLYDEAGGDTDDTLDTLVISGATHRTKINIVSAGDTPASIGRIITADDVQLHSLTFDGALVGDDTAVEPDLVLDGGVRLLSLGQMGGDVDWDGRIGGDVRALSMDTQAHGTLRVGGEVSSLTVNGGSAGPLLVATEHPTWADDDVTAIASDTTGNVWMYDAATETLHLVSDTDPDNAAPVTDAAGNAVSLTALDVLEAGNVMYGLATMWNQAPTVQLNTPEGGPADLVGLAVDRSYNIFAIEEASSSASGQDELVWVDSWTGVRTSVGVLRDVYGNLYSENVMALACDDAGTLYGVIRDFDGDAGGSTAADGMALVAIETTDTSGDGALRVGHPHANYRTSAPVLIDGGGVLDDEPFTAMAVNEDGRIFAIRRINGGTQDQLVELVIGDDAGTPPAVTMNVLGTVSLFGADTTIVGMGFDTNDNLVAYNNDGADADLIVVDTDSPADSSWLTVPGALSTDIDAYAFGRAADVWDTSPFHTYAYDTNHPQGSIVYTNPGMMETLGTVVVDAGTNEARFSLLRGLSEYAEADDGAPLSGRPVTSYLLDIAVDNRDTGHVFAIGSDGRLFEYERQHGDLVDTEDVVLVDSETGQTPSIGWIEFYDTPDQPGTGELIGFDTRHDRLVTINTDTGVTAPRTDSGVMSGDALIGLTHDLSSGSFFTFNTEDAALYRLRGTTQADLAGITATSIHRLSIDARDDGYRGRIATTGNTLRNASVLGDFAGHLAAGDDLHNFSLSGGDFAGSLVAGGSILNAVIRGGDMLVDAVIDAGRSLRNLQVNGGEFAGAVLAETAGFIRTGGLGVANDDVSADDLAWADIDIRGQADRVDLNGTYTGFVSLGAAGSLTLGALADGAYVRVAGDADRAVVRGDGDHGTYVEILGELGQLALGGTHEGVVAVRGGIGAARLGDLSGAILVAGEDTGSVVVGNMVESVLSFGTWIGDDLIYNSDDDVITGGSLGRAVVAGDLIDSAIVAGVLPNLNEGTDIPWDMWAYLGNEDYPIAYTDAAEAGGVLDSEIGLIVVRGNVTNSEPTAGRLNAAAAADGIGRVVVRRRGSLLRTRDYTDPFGAPYITDVRLANDSEIRVTFSEEMNSASLSLAQDTDGNGSVNDPWDIPGTVSIRDENNDYINDARLTYSTVTGDDGTVHGVLSIIRDGGFDSTMVQVEILGETHTGGLAAYDRSGRRSALRDPNRDGTRENNEDRPGTLLDGEANGIEGGNFWLLPFTSDVGDTFDDAWEIRFDDDRDGDFLYTADIIETFKITGADTNDLWADSDVFWFDAEAHDFFSLEYFGSSMGTVALFHLDDQGTPDDPDDDYHELVARYENTRWYPSDSVYQAFELPEDGRYYVVVGYQDVNATSYVLQLSLASSDDMFDGARDNGKTGVPTDEEVAYVSNRIGENNNEYGCNEALQLVYLNFDGGQTTKYFEQSGERDGPVEAMQAGWLHSQIEGMEEELIEGTEDGTVTGIVEHMMAVYETLPGDGINVHRIATLDEWQQAVADYANAEPDSGGLYFTTVDPATWELDPDSDFTTVFFGRNHLGASPSALGLASTVDFANMSKADNALVFANNYGGLSTATTITGLLNEYALALANTGAHELGHTLGLNHQPTFWETPDETILLEDDPDNAGPLTGADSNGGAYALMAYPPTEEDFHNLYLLGTLNITPNEFPIGEIDTASMIIRWLA